jgi:uncharacterized membrane protein
MTRLRIGGGPGDGPALETQLPEPTQLPQPAMQRQATEAPGSMRGMDNVDRLILGLPAERQPAQNAPAGTTSPGGLGAAPTELAMLWPKGTGLHNDLAGRVLGNLLNAAREEAENFAKAQINKIPVKLRLDQVENVLEDRGLKDSMVQRVQNQLNRNGAIMIGVIDDFRPGQTHGENVVQRILTNAPKELQGKIAIVRYDVGGLEGDARAKVMMNAAEDAKSGQLVGLSVSGGMNAYGVPAIEKWTGRPLNAANAEQAYDTIVQKAVAYGSMTRMEAQAFEKLNEAAKYTPVATPIWNKNTTTLAAAKGAGPEGNIIVTTIDNHSGSQATKIQGFADISIDPQYKNNFTSQSAPTFLGQMLHLAVKK